MPELAAPEITSSNTKETSLVSDASPSSQFKLMCNSGTNWLNAVLDDFDAFLLDHAACEKKASSMAMSLIAHYPDKPELIKSMAQLAVEELVHFREVVNIIQEMKLQLQPDIKDPYIQQLRKHIRRGKDHYLLDQLLLASVVEARGHERFGLVANALADGPLKKFYASITASEARHYELFLNLASRYFDPATVTNRLIEWLNIESTTILSLAPRAALH